MLQYLNCNAVKSNLSILIQNPNTLPFYSSWLELVCTARCMCEHGSSKAEADRELSQYELDTAAPLSGCHSNTRQFCSVGRTERVRCNVGCMRESVCVSFCVHARMLMLTGSVWRQMDSELPALKVSLPKSLSGFCSTGDWRLCLSEPL